MFVQLKVRCKSTWGLLLSLSVVRKNPVYSVQALSLICNHAFSLWHSDKNTGVRKKSTQ